MPPPDPAAGKQRSLGKRENIVCLSAEKERYGGSEGKAGIFCGKRSSRRMLCDTKENRFTGSNDAMINFSTPFGDR